MTGKRTAKRTTCRGHRAIAALLIAGFIGPLAAVTTTVPAQAATGVRGFVIFRFNGNPNMNHARAKGAVFVYAEATEGNRTNPHFLAARARAVAAGLYFGPLQLARPNESSGASQAQYFVAHGGGWNNSGMELPGAFEVEANPLGSLCYGLSQQAWVTWIQDFSSDYHSRTGRYPVIVTTGNWWRQCTGNTTVFTRSPLFILRWGASPGTLFGGWSTYAFWDHVDVGPLPGEQVVFNGDQTALEALATTS